MNAATQVICSCALTFGVPIVIAGWELWRLGSVRSPFAAGGGRAS